MSPGAPLGDDELGRLLAEGLAAGAAAPVDERRLVAGAERGAARIRRRRRAATALAAVVAIGIPAGIVGSRLVAGGGSTSSATTAGKAMDSQVSTDDAATPMMAPAEGASGPGAAGAASSAAPGSSGGAAGGAAAAATTSVRAASSASVPSLLKTPPASTAQPSTGTRSAATTASATPAPAPTAVPTAVPTALRRNASGAVVVPDSALPTATEAGRAARGPVVLASDTRNAEAAPPVTAVDVCGRSPGAVPAEAGGRSVTFGGGSGLASGRFVATAVRVFAHTDAVVYLAALQPQGCLTAAPGTAFQAALAGHGAPDGQGRTHWFAVGRTGRVVVEIRVVVPAGAGATRADVVALLTSSGRRVLGSGLPAAAATDPGLR